MRTSILQWAVTALGTVALAGVVYFGLGPLVIIPPDPVYSRWDEFGRAVVQAEYGFTAEERSEAVTVLPGDFLIKVNGVVQRPSDLLWRYGAPSSTISYEFVRGEKEIKVMRSTDSLESLSDYISRWSSLLVGLVLWLLGVVAATARRRMPGGHFLALSSFVWTLAFTSSLGYSWGMPLALSVQAVTFPLACVTCLHVLRDSFGESGPRFDPVILVLYAAAIGIGLLGIGEAVSISFADYPNIAYDFVPIHVLTLYLLTATLVVSPVLLIWRRWRANTAGERADLSLMLIASVLGMLPSALFDLGQFLVPAPYVADLGLALLSRPGTLLVPAALLYIVLRRTDSGLDRTARTFLATFLGLWMATFLAVVMMGLVTSAAGLPWSPGMIFVSMIVAFVLTLLSMPRIQTWSRGLIRWGEYSLVDETRVLLQDLSRASSLDSILVVLVDRVADVFGVSNAVLLLRIGEDGKVIQRGVGLGEKYHIDSWSLALDGRPVWCPVWCPISTDGEIVGYLGLGHRDNRLRWGEEERTLVDQITLAAGVSYRHAHAVKLHSQVEEMRLRESERARAQLGAEIHDQIQPIYRILSLSSEARSGVDAKEVTALAAQVLNGIRDVLRRDEESRESVSLAGVVSEFEMQTKRGHTSISLTCSLDEPALVLSGDQAWFVRQFLAEMTTNLAKHAGGHPSVVTCIQAGPSVVISSETSVALTEETARGAIANLRSSERGLGLLRRAVRALGGDLTLDMSDHSKFVVVATLPVSTSRPYSGLAWA